MDEELEKVTNLCDTRTRRTECLTQLSHVAQRRSNQKRTRPNAVPFLEKGSRKQHREGPKIIRSLREGPKIIRSLREGPKIIRSLKKESRNPLPKVRGTTNATHKSNKRPKHEETNEFNGPGPNDIIYKLKLENQQLQLNLATKQAELNEAYKKIDQKDGVIQYLEQLIREK
ncbi:hypothetical protein HK104_008988 [Borealophlyctis nickersoniae]|nr:hypothetical protein HK104_008988 [Borealophlyctis nickersoniae]